MKCNELLQVENMTVLNSTIRSLPNTYVVVEYYANMHSYYQKLNTNTNNPPLATTRTTWISCSVILHFCLFVCLFVFATCGYNSVNLVSQSESRIQILL